MIARGVRQSPRLPRAVSSATITTLVILVTLVVWAAFLHSPAATDDGAFQPLPASPADFHSFIYSDSSPSLDTIYLRSMTPQATPRPVSLFPVVDGLHVRGKTSPGGQDVAVLSPAGPASSDGVVAGSLTVLALPSGVRSQIDGDFDYRANLLWSADSRYVLLTTPPASTAGTIDVVQADVITGKTLAIARFPAVFEVAPVGFSADGTRLYIVSVDKSGSILWQLQDNKVSRVATLSAGRTRDWALSPDGARLAFVDILGSGEPGYVGRTLVLATGVVSSTPASANQFSPAWVPGSEVPIFGGPGGQLKLTAPQSSGAYPVPRGYSPDGTGLVATVYPATGAQDSAASRTTPGSLEIVSPDQRIQLTQSEGSSFFGWVRDFN